MEILELNLKGYGKFINHKIAFTPGINVIYGGNETGKTTIHSFICAMLFGLNRGRGRAASLDEYQLRQPWDSPGTFLGSMRFKQDGKVYRIDRCFDHSARPLSLVCETDAREYSDPQAGLDELLGGLSEAAFVNSVFIPQMHSEIGETLAEELQRTMINHCSSMDEEVDVAKALQSLRRKKKEREQEKKKEEEALQEEISKKQERSDELLEEINQLRSQEKGKSKELTYMGSSDWYGAVPEKKEEPKARRSGELSTGMRRLLIGMLIAAAVLTAAGIFMTTNLAICIFLGVFTVFFGTMAIGVHYLFAPEDEEREEEPEQTQEYTREIKEKEASYRKQQEDLEILYQQHADSIEDAELDALTLAIDRICEISSGIFRTNGSALNESASRILEEITGGRYTRITIDDTGEVRIHTPSRVLSLKQLSGGTVQQIYFALRLSAGDLFCGENRFPLILDETFSMYDDERLKATLAWLKKSERQVILFTAQKREREILKQL